MVPPPPLLLFYLTWGVRKSAIEGVTAAFGEVFELHKRQVGSTCTGDLTAHTESLFSYTWSTFP